MKVFRIILLALLSIGLFYYANFLLTYKKEHSRINLSEFEGRIYSSSQASYQGSSSINVSLAEATRFGEKAILSFNDEYIEIWEPDYVTNGTFFYHKMELKDGFWSYEVKKRDKDLVINQFPGSTAKGLFLLLFVLAIIGWIFEIIFF